MTLWLLLRGGGRRCALPVGKVLRVAPAAATVPLPRSPAWVDGIAAYGRDLVPQVVLGALIGDEAGGRQVVVAQSGAGPVALRVEAVERVIDLAEPVAGAALVAGRAWRGGEEILLLDLAHLVLPVAERPPGPSRAASAADPARDVDKARDAGPLELVCALDDGFVALPLARVASVERAAAGMELIDPLGRSAPSAGAVTAVTVALPGGSLVLGLGSVVGLRRPGTPGYHDARAIDCDALAGRVAQSAAPGGGIDRPALPPDRVMYLLGAGDRLALIPGSKAVRVGPLAHWRALPGGKGPDGLVPVGGDILPGLDLGRLFGDAARPRAFAMAFDARGSRWAIACDSISERRGRIEGRPATRDGLAMLGQARIAEGLVPVLDTDRFVLPWQEA